MLEGGWVAVGLRFIDMPTNISWTRSWSGGSTSTGNAFSGQKLFGAVFVVHAFRNMVLTIFSRAF